MVVATMGFGEVKRMRDLLIRASLDILKLENKVYELETRCKVSDADRFTVRHPLQLGNARK